MRYYFPAPTTIVQSYRVPSHMTAENVEAFIARVAGDSLLSFEVADVSESCSCTTTVSVRLQFKRILPGAMQRVIETLQLTAIATLGAACLTPGDTASPYREAWSL